MMPTQMIPDEQARQLMVALAKHVGLDPDQTISIEARAETDDTIRVDWTGTAVIPRAEFEALLNP